MLILGINDTHDASACLLKDGEIIAAAEEERFQRVKNMSTFPHYTIRHFFKELALSYKDIDHVAIATEKIAPTNLYNMAATFKVPDYIKMHEQYFYPQIYQNTQPALQDIFPHYEPIGDMAYPLEKIPFATLAETQPIGIQELQIMRRNFTADFLGIDPAKIAFYNHHRCHAYYGYYTHMNPPDDVAILTLDGGGDGAYTSIRVADQYGHIKLLLDERVCLIGKIYASITLLLGMNPHRHLYKVMGMAPYANEHEKAGPRSVFLNALSVDGLHFVRNPEVKDFYFYFKDQLKQYRFDGIAGGLQDFVEIRLSEWFNNVAHETGIKNFIFSGGAANNVKANLCITQLSEVNSLYVPPGPGDESLSIGAAFAAAYDLQGPKFCKKELKIPKTAYWGSEITLHDQKIFEDHSFIKKYYKKVDDHVIEVLAQALKDGEVVAICRGKMEFGPRALGNRSLLSHPTNLATKRKLNDLIKHRDFWMPFSPMILDDIFEDYIKNPKKINDTYMTVCFETTELGRSNLAAAVHPADETARPQRITQYQHPFLYDLISEFRKITDIGGLLNTSLNIHEKPIVHKPIDIINEILVDKSVPLRYILVENSLYIRID